MEASPSLSLRILYFIVLLIIQSQTVVGQSVAKAQKEFDNLNKAYHSDKLSAKKYLDSAFNLANQYLSEGTHFKTQELTDLLSLYKEIATGKKALNNSLYNYYVIFLNNALMYEQTGTSMYYAEKIAQIYKRNGEKHSLIEAMTKSQIYMEEELYEKVIDQYVKEKPYMKSLPDLLRRNQVDIATGIDALTILSAGVVESYIKTKDTAAVYDTNQLVYQIGNAIKHKPRIHRQYMLFNDFFMLISQYFVASFENDQAKAGKILSSLASLKTIYRDQSTGFIDQNLFPWSIDHYLTFKNADSAEVYIKKYETAPFFNKNQQAKINEYKAKLQSLKGDLAGSNKWLSIALANERKVQTKLMEEMTNLLYVNTEAENSRIDLQHSEAIKRQQTVWLVVISISAALTVITIYLIMLYRSRKAKAQIEALNNTANMQVIAMEEVKYQAIREEQQRLGQDLHDGLSSSIAAIRHQLETLALATDNITLKNKLGRLQAETERAYEVARRKSHEWFSTGDQQQGQSFEKQIRILTESALPDSRYNKTIQIDDSSLMDVSTDIRITLLRIIQEAITNIIKHAKAKNIGILIYDEMDMLIMAINDDGIGLNETKAVSKKTAMGLASIRRRVEYLSGEINIDSDISGTEIIVSIPLK